MGGGQAPAAAAVPRYGCFMTDENNRPPMISLTILRSVSMLQICNYMGTIRMNTELAASAIVYRDTVFLLLLLLFTS